MARTKQRLINYHTTGTTVPATGDVQGGEIVVRNNETKPELLIRAGSGFAVFEASAAVKTRIDNAIETAKTNLVGQIDALTTAIGNVSGAVEDNYALKSEVTAVSNKLSGYATTEVTEGLDTRLTEAESDITGLTTATGSLSSDLSTLSGSVVDDYATKTVAQGYANAASAEAKSYVDTKLTEYAKTSVTDALDGRIDALEAISGESHSHENKDVLDGITSGKVTEWDEAYSQRHTHANKNVLDTITTAKTAAWDSALRDAKNYADEKIEGLSGNTVAAITGLEQTINTKISAAYVYKGSVTNYSDLPESGKTVGFVYNVVNANGDIPAGTNYAWNGTAWDALGGSVDLSEYATTAVTNGLRSDLTTAQDNISTLTTATGTLNTAIGNVSGAVEDNYALKSEVTAVSNKLSGYATTEVTEGLDTRLTEAESDITGLTTATGSLSSDLSTLSGSVVDDYATKTVAQGYANAASAQAKTYVDTKLAGYATTAVTNGLDTRIDALEAISGESHSHENKDVLDGITSTKTGNWDTAYTKATNAVQSLKVTGVTGVDVTGTTAVTIDMTDLVIDCGEF